VFVVRLDRTTQYSEKAVIESRSRGVLDAPPEPVIGLAEGETRWRGMTAVGAYPFFLTSLTLANSIPSARSLV
jgi:hypothetical protein